MTVGDPVGTAAIGFTAKVSLGRKVTEGWNVVVGAFVGAKVSLGRKVTEGRNVVVGAFVGSTPLATGDRVGFRVGSD